MAEKLETIMRILHSDESRLAFLTSIYIPGNTEVADKILTINPENSFILENETAHAKSVGDINRFRDMAKRNIDWYVQNDCDILLQNKVINWQDSELADYAIELLTSKSKEGRRLEGSLRYAAEIAQSFGKKDVAKQNLEKFLALQERDAKYKFPAGDTLKKLGRFSEAIDKYVESAEGRCSGFMGDALQIARENVPERVKEIAQIGFDAYEPTTGFEEIYVECAEILGKTKKAEKILVKYSKSVKVKDAPRFYEGVIKSLVKLGRDQKAKNLVERVRRNEVEAKRSERYYDFDRSEELARLYHAVGEIDAVREIYKERINIRNREGHHPSNTLHDIKKAIELTGYISFREEEFGVYERQKEYKKAANLANELGKPELAQMYNTMYEMVESVKGKN